jgi:glycosidase
MPWGNELVYHIFVDRFRNGNRAIDVKEGEFTFRGTPVGSSGDRRRLTGDRTHQHTFYNGDLPGIRAAIPYLADWGVTTVLLSPIFKSHSTHRYDTDDYFQLDPHVGTDDDFRGLVSDLHARGMKLALDGVFGHTSFEHPWYRDPAERQRTYRLRPDGTPETWLDWGVMPKLETDDPAVQDRLLEIVDRWPGVDAWRLDAAQHLPASFLRRFRGRLRRRTPHGIVIAEEWEPVHSQLHDGLYDGTLNFQFRRPVVDFFRHEISAETLARRLSAYIEGYPPHALRHCWNLLGNHDTERFYGHYAKEAATLRLAIALQTLLPGTPHLYYGDEIGMRGRDSHEARAPMEWREDRWDRAVQAAHREFLGLRCAHPVFAEGFFRWLRVANRERLLAFERWDSDERARVLVNAGPNPARIEIEGRTFEVPPQDVGVHFG